MSLLAGGQPTIPYGLDRVLQGFAFYSATLSGAVTMDDTYPNICKLDPGGSSRNVTLPPEETSAGRILWIVNSADASENLALLNDALSPSTIATANQNESAVLYCDGTSWSLVAIVAIALS